eukprot:GHRR01028885.1.p1 GENE.GHRR01028885.1~~GHRR01028885.1.p1  ORF type:complete len:187 (+),score=70.72 GHRR01028885.1:939-1499(+)
MNQEGEVTIEPCNLTADIKPGLLDGTHFMFQGQGDAAAANQPAADIVLLLKSAPHPVFRRQLADLVACVQLPLLQALVGGAVSIQTLDGRVLSVPLEDIITPGLTIRVPGEGMPIPGGGKGDLTLEFALVFPTHLTQQQKMLIKAALFLPAKPDQAQSKALRAFEAAFRDTAHGWSTGVVKQDGSA